MICEGEGPEECKTVYESNCETSYHEHEVEDDVVDCVEEYEEKCEDVTQGMLKKYRQVPLPMNKICVSIPTLSLSAFQKKHGIRFEESCRLTDMLC